MQAFLRMIFDMEGALVMGSGQMIVHHHCSHDEEGKMELGYRTRERTMKDLLRRTNIKNSTSLCDNLGHNAITAISRLLDRKDQEDQEEPQLMRYL